MKPGSELDALIAEKVMGLDPKIFNRSQSYYEIASEGFSLKNYSTNIAAAWEVVEKITTDFSKSNEINGNGFRLDYRNETTSSDNQVAVTISWTVCAPPYEEMGDRFTVFGNTPAHAICLAALKLVGFIYL